MLKNGGFEKDDSALLPKSWMLQKEWTEILQKADPSYGKFIHLAAVNFADMKLEQAEEMCKKALAIAEGPAVFYILSQISRLKGNIKDYGIFAEKVRVFLPEDISVARMAFTALLESENYELIVSNYKRLSPEVKCDGRVTMLYGFALLRLGEIENAEEAMNQNGGITVSDIQEGEISLTQLYIQIEEAKAKRDNLPFDAKNVAVPKRFDFRMFV